MARLVVLAVLGTMMALSCGSGEQPTLTAEFDRGLDGDNQTPLGLPATRTPTPGPTSTPTAQSVEAARNVVWSFVGQCLFLDPNQLDAYLVQGGWFVQASTGSRPSYGLWRVDAADGGLEAQDPLARDLTSYVDSQCSRELLPAPFLPTPSPTLSPGPTATPAPTSTPVAQNADEARNLVWVFLGQCFSLDPGQLEALLVRGDWFVKSSGNSAVEYGLWKVDAETGSLEPQDPLARELVSYLDSRCSVELLPAPFVPTPTPTPRPSPTPSPSPAPTSTPTPTTTPAPTPTPTLTPTPTPSPTPPPVVTKAEEAVVAVWSHLVPCFRDKIPITDLEARFDPARGRWVVVDITIADAATDYGVWTVDPVDGTISPENRKADFADQRVRSGIC